MSINKIYNDGNIIICELSNRILYFILDDVLLKEFISDNDTSFNDVSDLNDSVIYGMNLIKSDNNVYITIDEIDMFKGKIIKVYTLDTDVCILINKNLFPISFKKAEYNNLSYAITDGSKEMILKKKFKDTVEGGSFSMIVEFKIV